MTDQEIITLIQNDPERGMGQLVEQYTGLLWSVCSPLLREPEDIKDCVNEAFAEFFGQREKFDPAKGSLKGYLAVIVRRLAIKKYQENHRSAGREFSDGENTDLLHRFEQREELDSYLCTLEPEDEQIIRMKYYGGMTAKEIAASLGLPYETVKKRHQRSLKKLRKAMLIGLIVAAIAVVVAACAYVVLRYFGVVPGYGISTDPAAGVYVMETQPVTVENEDFQLTIQNAWWMNGILTLDGDAALLASEGPDNVLLNNTEYSKLTVAGLNEPKQGTQSCSLSDSADREKFRMIWQGNLPEETKDTLTLTLCWENGAACTLVLERTEDEISFEQVGYYDMTEEKGGLLAVPRLENGELIVAIYPLNEGEYTIHPMLTGGPYATFETECRDITATAEDGTVLVGQMTWGGFSNNTYFEWNFGPAQPGKYTLNVPFVYETMAEGAEEEVLIRDVELNGEACELDIVFPFEGGEVRLTREVPATDYVYAIAADTEEVLAMNKEYAKYRWWDIDTEYISADPDRTVVGVSFLVVEDPNQVVLEVNGSIVGLPRVMHMSRTESLPDGTQKLLGLRIGTYGDDAARLLLDPQQVGYRWNHEFNIDFEVSETE